MSIILPLHIRKNFDWETYLLNYPDLEGLQTREDTLHHYASVGRYEHRTDSVPSIFDWERYLDTYKHLRLNTGREAYIHFMRSGMKYKQPKHQCHPVAKLILSQYEQIIEFNQTCLKTPTIPLKPFTLLPKPKNQTSVKEYRQPHTPNLLNPPKEPLKKTRTDESILDRVQPKIMAATPTAKHQIQDTASSIMKPSPTQKVVVPQQTFPDNVWTPQQMEEKRPSTAPSIFQPLQQPSRSGIIRTSGEILKATPRPPQQASVFPPLEHVTQKRSQAPSQFEPLRKPSRLSIIHTSTKGEQQPLPQHPIPFFVESATPALEKPRSSEAPSLFQPLKQPSRSTIIKTKTTEETIPRPAPWPPQSFTTATTKSTKRVSQAPKQMQPLKNPSRSNIIKTRTVEETIVHTRRPKPATTRPVQEKYVHQPYKHPSRTSSKQPAFSAYPFQPLPKSRHALKSVIAARLAQKKASSTVPFWYSNKCHVRQPKPSELVLKESPSQYFSKMGVTIGSPKYVNEEPSGKN